MFQLKKKITKNRGSITGKGNVFFSLSQTPWHGVGHTGGPVPWKTGGLGWKLV
jgi:hypothetical protein